MWCEDFGNYWQYYSEEPKDMLADLKKKMKEETGEETNTEIKKEECTMSKKYKYRTFKVLKHKEGLDGLIDPKTVINILRKNSKGKTIGSVPDGTIHLTKVFGKITVAILKINEETFKIGFAFCSPKDVEQNIYTRTFGRNTAKDRVEGSPYEHHTIQFSLPGCFPNKPLLKGLAMSESSVRNISWMKGVRSEDMV